MGLLPHQFWGMTLAEFGCWSKGLKHEEERHWARTSAMMALVANTQRSQKSKAYKPNDFNPYAKATEHTSIPTTDQIEYLKKWQGNPS